MDKFRSLGGQTTPKSCVKEGGGIGEIFVKKAVFGCDTPPITHFNTGISHYYIYARRDGILTLLGVGRGTSRCSRVGHTSTFQRTKKDNPCRF